MGVWEIVQRIPAPTDRQEIARPRRMISQTPAQFHVLCMSPELAYLDLCTMHATDFPDVAAGVLRKGKEVSSVMHTSIQSF
eukprot:scaffold11804_cov18-Tisochrysis_lutea.AAC.4